MKEISGDLLSVEAEYIVQQCNCLTITAKGLSAAIDKEFPECNPYKKRCRESKKNIASPDTRGVPGQAIILKRRDGCGFVANLMGQWRPSAIGSRSFGFYPPCPIPSVVETAEQRKTWFKSGMAELLAHIVRKHAAATSTSARSSSSSSSSGNSSTASNDCDDSSTGGNNSTRRPVVRVALPFGIGCGLAGGKWVEYRRLISQWEESIPPKHLGVDVEVLIVKLNR
eukprot:TRINITY_DN2327_c0_g2_i1.p2 TRINITY_DN2327_c0_g2~~TRINITY_DN2327_c0_g2_i1.p2  ORF type:complete len:226 (+),score=39.29 TRINITY_DN2327_c0_g2_i1:170-847(+)